MGHLLKLTYAHSSVPSPYFSLNKCPITSHDGANAKFSINCDDTDYSAYSSNKKNSIIGGL
jgi:hypothetical protein